MCTVRAFASLCALVVSTHYRKDGPAMSPMLSFCAILEILVKEVFRCVHFGVFAFLRFLRSSNPHASASRLKAKAAAPKAEASIPCKANSFDKEGKYKIWNKIHREKNCWDEGECVSKTMHAWTLKTQHDHITAYATKCEWLCAASQSSGLLKTPVQQSNLPCKTWSVLQTDSFWTTSDSSTAQEEGPAGSATWVAKDKSKDSISKGTHQVISEIWMFKVGEAFFKDCFE